MSNREEVKNIPAEARRAWTAPSLRRISAGSAENGGADVADGGLPS